MKEITKISKIFWMSLLIMLIGLTIPAKAGKPSQDDCLACHSDKDISKTANGKTISLWIKKDPFTHSVHGKMLCVDCHKDFNPDDIPHKANIQAPDCNSCHKNVAAKHTFHPQMNAVKGQKPNKDLTNCKGCHGSHDIQKPNSSLSLPGSTNATEFCGRCHKDQKAQHIKSEHYQAFLRNNPKAPNCNTCHAKPVTKYWIKDELELREKQQQLCLSCHNNKDNNKKLKTIDYSNSNHGKAHARGRYEAANCIDCHGIHNIMKPDSANSSINKFNIPQLCRKCHLSITQEFLTSFHGRALTKGNKDAPSCITCHNEHKANFVPKYDPKLLKDNYLDSNIVIKNKMINCAACHTNDEFQKRNHLKPLNEAHSFMPNRDMYMKDVRCVDCHTANSSSTYMSHNILPQTKMVKNCIDCHKFDKWLSTRLSKYQKSKAKKEMGQFEGAILTDGGLSRSTFNLLFDSIGLIVIGLIVVILIIHSILRWYFKRSGGKK